VITSTGAEQMMNTITTGLSWRIIRYERQYGNSAENFTNIVQLEEEGMAVDDDQKFMLRNYVGKAVRIRDNELFEKLPADRGAYVNAMAVQTRYCAFQRA
jgi:hypothetical protein